jgi:hypothetical protein
VQIAVAMGEDDEAARHIRELEGIAGRFGTVGLVAASVQARAITST